MGVKKPQLDSLQALRTIAFLEIIAAHTGVFPNGAWGVTVFFALSGFVMVYNYFDREIDYSVKGSVGFSLNKIKKLYPLHILMTLGALPFVLYDIKFNPGEMTVSDALIQGGLNITLLQTWYPDTTFNKSFNSVAWYLSACLFIYACFPFIISKIRKFKSDASAYVMIAIIYALMVLVGFLMSFTGDADLCKWVTYYLPIYRLGDFVIGCGLGYIFIKKPWKFNKANSTILEIALVAVIVVCTYIYKEELTFLGSPWFKFSELYIPSTALLLMVVASGEGILTKMCTNKAFLWIAAISGSGFLIHLNIIRYVDALTVKGFGFQLNAWEMFAVSTALTFIACIIWQRIEKKFGKK